MLLDTERHEDVGQLVCERAIHKIVVWDSLQVVRRELKGHQPGRRPENPSHKGKQSTAQQ